MRGPLRIVSIAGTRPEAIKLAPVIRALARHDAIEHVLIATGQHGRMFHEALDPFGILADVDLETPNNGMEDFCAALAVELPTVLRSFAPHLVLVQGDTSSAWAGARAAAAAGIPIGHVEAGLRSGDPMLPWPEERNRREIDALSSLLFAPSQHAADNLKGMRGRIHITGNTGIDAMSWILGRRAGLVRRLPRPDEARTILVTCHRSESIPHIPALMAALDRIARRGDVLVRLPVHPNPAIGDTVRRHARCSVGLVLEEPRSFPDLLTAMQQAHILLTDSGGLQEEAPALGLPTLVLRANTERPEPIWSGNAILVGHDADRIVAETARLLDDPFAHAAMSRPSHPYGKGDAADRIVEAIIDWATEAVEIGSAFQ